MFAITRLILSFGILFYVMGINCNVKGCGKWNVVFTFLPIEIMLLAVTILFIVDGIVWGAIIEGIMTLAYAVFLVIAYHKGNDNE